MGDATVVEQRSAIVRRGRDRAPDHAAAECAAIDLVREGGAVRRLAIGGSGTIGGAENMTESVGTKYRRLNAKRKATQQNLDNKHQGNEQRRLSR
ncbi:hypothetical protein OSH12_09920 [Kaistia terrae]|nr:hypothetical protein [Kaistia terrae]